MDILITGGSGYIAKALNDNLKHNITTPTRQNFDLSSYDATCEWFNERQFDVVLHTAISGGSRLHEDDSVVLQQNLAMYNNLLVNKTPVTKSVNFCFMFIAIIFICKLWKCHIFNN